MMALLAEKLHHEYYWLCLAPVVAAGLGRAWVRLADWHRGLAWALALLLVWFELFLVRSTWQTPGEWQDLETAAARVQDIVPLDALAGRSRAFALRGGPPGLPARVHPAGCGPGRGGVARRARLRRYVARRSDRVLSDSREPGSWRTLAPEPGDARRIALHQEIRQRYKVLVDDASVIIAELNPPASARHGH